MFGKKNRKRDLGRGMSRQGGRTLNLLFENFKSKILMGQVSDDLLEEMITEVRDAVLDDQPTGDAGVGHMFGQFLHGPFSSSTTYTVVKKPAEGKEDQDEEDEENLDTVEGILDDCIKNMEYIQEKMSNHLKKDISDEERNGLHEQIMKVERLLEGISNWKGKV